MTEATPWVQKFNVPMEYLPPVTVELKTFALWADDIEGHMPTKVYYKIYIDLPQPKTYDEWLLSLFQSCSPPGELSGLQPGKMKRSVFFYEACTKPHQIGAAIIKTLLDPKTKSPYLTMLEREDRFLEILSEELAKVTATKFDPYGDQAHYKDDVYIRCITSPHVKVCITARHCKISFVDYPKLDGNQKKKDTARFGLGVVRHRDPVLNHTVKPRTPLTVDLKAFGFWANNVEVHRDLDNYFLESGIYRA
ncbi:hypothetical protein HDU76_006293 [Blyttiomyces sp. JEL0837]|nr:hypothetical protein HDU76_006293 [Blyttiomyces sp. JEL0837]